MKKYILFCFLFTFSLILGGCFDEEVPTIEDTVEFKNMKTMTENIVTIRTSNISYTEIDKLLEPYESLIADKVWQNWFNTNNIVPRKTYAIAEQYGGYPVHNSIDIITYGKPIFTNFVSNDGFVFMVASTLDVKNETLDEIIKIKIHYLFEYNEEGVLTHYVQWDRPL